MWYQVVSRPNSFKDLPATNQVKTNIPFQVYSIKQFDHKSLMLIQMFKSNANILPIVSADNYNNGYPLTQGTESSSSTVN